MEGDIAAYTIEAVDDPRTLNKVVFIKPPKNTYSFNELVALWEKKIGKTLEKEYITEEQLLKQIEGDPHFLRNNLSQDFHSIICSDTVQ